MLEVIERNSKLKETIIISIVLHIILFYILTRDRLNKHVATSSISNKPPIDVMMIDPLTIEKGYNYNCQQQQQINTEYIRDNLEDHGKKQIGEIHKTQFSSQGKNLKQTKVRQTREKQLQEAMSEQAKKQTITINKKPQIRKQEITGTEDIDDFLEKLSYNNGVSKFNNKERKIKSTSLAKTNDTENNSFSLEKDVKIYTEQIKVAIENHFYDPSSYEGKTCVLRIRLAPDGMLVDIQSEGGDPALCAAALDAAKRTKIPDPPSKEVYEIFKNVLLDFRPGTSQKQK